MSILLIIIVAITGLLAGGLATATILRKQILRKTENLLKEAEKKAEVLKKRKNSAGQGKIPPVKIRA